MSQERLFVLAIESIAVGAQFVPGEGWSVSVRTRRQGDTWSTEPGTTETRLSTTELFSLVADELERALGL